MNCNANANFSIPNKPSYYLPSMLPTTVIDLVPYTKYQNSKKNIPQEHPAVHQLTCGQTR